MFDRQKEIDHSGYTSILTKGGHMENVNVSKVIGAGFVATCVMTMLMYVAPMMGIPKMDIASMLGYVLSSGMPQPWTLPWWTGMMMHFINGTLILPVLYSYLFYPFFAGRPWLRGTDWGFILWLLAQAMVMPMMGMGFFSAKLPEAAMAVMGSLIGHIVYGAIFGALAGEQSHSGRAGYEAQASHA